MGLEDEYLLARDHVARIDFSYLTPTDPTAFPPAWPKALPPLTYLLPPHETTYPLPLPPHLESPQAALK